MPDGSVQREARNAPRLLLVTLVATAILLAGAGTAAADPTNSPKSFTVVTTCDGGSIALTDLDNPSPNAWTATTSVGIAVALTLTNAATGDVIFHSEVPGFNKNVVPTQTCLGTFDGVIVTVVVLFTPASP
jgi:hypothetical protein